MDGHRDGISCMAKNPNYLKGIFSASMDGGLFFFPPSFNFIAEFDSEYDEKENIYIYMYLVIA